MPLFTRAHHIAVASTLVLCASVLLAFAMATGIYSAESYDLKREDTVAKLGEHIKDIQRMFKEWRRIRGHTKSTLFRLADERANNHRGLNEIKALGTASSIVSTGLTVLGLVSGFFPGGATLPWALSPSVGFATATAGRVVSSVAGVTDDAREVELFYEAKSALKRDKIYSDKFRKYISNFIGYVDNDYCKQVYILNAYKLNWFGYIHDVLDVFYDLIQLPFGGSKRNVNEDMMAKDIFSETGLKKDTIVAALAHLGIDVTKMPSKLGGGRAAQTYFQTLGIEGKVLHVGLMLWNIRLLALDIHGLSKLLDDINNNVDTKVSKAVREQAESLAYPKEEEFSDFIKAFLNGKCPLT